MKAAAAILVGVFWSTGIFQNDKGIFHGPPVRPLP
jgi:hypothetical protein